MRSSEPIATDERIPSPPRRYTLDGDQAVEARIERDQQTIAAAVRAVVPAEQFVALVLMGGYGRGEGGYRDTAAGPEPYNDYDYFVVLRRGNSRERADTAAKLAVLARRLESEVGVEVDFALLRLERLRRLEFSLMNTEMAWGHRVVAGDTDVLLGMRRMPFHRLPPGEMTRLLNNRGTLLLMNEVRLQQGGLDAPAREIFFKYLLKAVLACGDARLALAGRYHPSYPVKLQRLEAATTPGRAGALRDAEKFLELYRVAYEHKFHPRYEVFDDAVPKDWQARVVRAWLTTTREFEIRRRGAAFENWAHYCRSVIRKGQSRNAPRNLAISIRDFGLGEVLRRPKRALRYPRERLIGALPLLLSEPASLLDPCVADALALRPQTLWKDAAEAYLRLWKRYA